MPAARAALGEPVGDDGQMPQLVEPALPFGALRDLDQPTLVLDDQLTLRPCGQPKDAEAVRTAFDCPDIQRWHVRRMDSHQEASRWIEDWAYQWKGEAEASWAIADTRDDHAIGQVGLRTISLFEAHAQLSYWMAPAARGRACAVQATRALTRWSFDVLGLNRLFLQHSAGNLASCRVAEKAGFQLEGNLRQSMLHADGWHDVHLHARLRSDAD